jgi:tetratricopeptide (TPR) repeat protein
LRARWPGLFAAWLAFGFLIAPVSGVFQAGPHFAADRYTYLAVIPFSALIAAILPDSRLSLAAAAMALAVLAGLSWRQTKVWTNSESLWDHAVAVRPKDPVALNNRGGLRASKGRIKEAMVDFEACLQVLPSYPSALANRARARALSGDGAGALRDIDEALRQDPTLATLTEVRGIARMTTGDATGALADFDQALSRPPRKAEILYLRGSLRHQQGALAGAFEDYSEALGLNPNLGEAWFNRGLLQEARGARDAAVGDFARCVSLNPKDVAARLKYGAALRARGGAGDVDAAILELEKALREAPAGWPARSAALAELEAAKRLKR